MDFDSQNETLKNNLVAAHVMHCYLKLPAAAV